MKHMQLRMCVPDEGHTQAALQLSETSIEDSCSQTECNKRLSNHMMYLSQQHNLAKSGKCSAGGLQHSGKGRGKRGGGDGW